MQRLHVATLWISTLLVSIKTLYNKSTKFSVLRHTHCFVCRQSSHVLVCRYCQQDTPIPLFPVPGHNLLEYEAVYKHLAEPHYEGLFALGSYSGVLVGLINQLKFSGKPLAANVLSGFFYQYLHLRLLFTNNLPEALIPIPLSKFRYLKREYNQSRLLAEKLGEYFDIPVIDALARNRHTKQQAILGKEQRLINIENAFKLVTEITVSSVAVVDDVVTTGATVNAACKQIQLDYPDISIRVWCMAVTLNKNETASELRL